MTKDLRLVGQPELPIVFEDPAFSVFDFWRTVMQHPRAQLGPKRRHAITGMLRAGYTVDDLRLAVYGCKCSPRHQGQNEHGEIYDDLELIVRDEAHVDRFMAMGERRLMREAQQQRSAVPSNSVPMPDYIRDKLAALVGKNKSG